MKSSSLPSWPEPDAVGRGLAAGPRTISGAVSTCPKVPGIYALWSRHPSIGSIPGTLTGEIYLYYVGSAGRSLRGRLLQHVRGPTGASTFRRTLAALWQSDYRWETARVPSNPVSADATSKFRTVLASPYDEVALSELMAESFLVSWIQHPDPNQVERGVIDLLRPPLNLQHNRDHPSYAQVRALRSAFNASASVNLVRPVVDVASDLGELRKAARRFSAAREWEQFHSPKNLAMALAGEVGELLAELQWLTEDQIAAQVAHEPLRGRVADEIADVLMYLVRFADVCGIDPLSAAWEKIERNEVRYPVDKARGNARKYTDLADEDQA